MTMTSGRLLERDKELGELAALLAAARAGEGRVALVYGEAGIGKTTLLKHFARENVKPPVRLFWGGCDALFTPRPLAPLQEVAWLHYDQVEEQVFARAGMTGSSSPIESEAVPGRSIGYTREESTAAWASAADTLPYRGTSAGGGDSTVNDLLRFANALTRHQLLDAEHTALLTTGKVATEGESKYAYGFSDDDSDGVGCFGHGGGAPGMNGELLICDSGYTVAALANVDPPAASRLVQSVRRRLPQR